MGATVGRRRSCRSCRVDDLAVVVDLGEQPASDDFPARSAPLPDPAWPLALALCRRCALVQLTADASVQPEPLPARESDTARRHAVTMSSLLLERLRVPEGGTVRETVSHHGGSWSPALRDRGLRVLPTGRADLVLDVHALAHERDLDDALRRLAGQLAPHGRLVLEFHHLLPLVQQTQFDTVRHGHPSYLSLTALLPALARHGLTAVDAVPTSAYGGSLVVAAARTVDAPVTSWAVDAVLRDEDGAGLGGEEAFRRLQERTRQVADGLREHLLAARSSGRRVLGYGAPSKAPVLLGVSGVGPDLLAFTVDRSEAKHGRRLPGSGIPIEPVARLLAERPDEVLLLTWDIAAEVRASLPEVEAWGGRFILPLPEVRVLR